MNETSTQIEQLDALINKLIEELTKLKIKEWNFEHIELLKTIIELKKTR